MPACSSRHGQPDAHFILRCLTFFCCLCLVLSSDPVSAQSAQGDASRLYAEITQTGPYQLVLPDQSLPERGLRRSGGSTNGSGTYSQDDTSEAETGDEDNLLRNSPEVFDPPDGAWLQNEASKTVTETLLWSVIILVLCFLAVYWLRELLYSVRRTETPAPAPEAQTVRPARKAAPSAPRRMSDYENYAEEGRYDDAVRAMLIQCIQTLLSRTKQSNASSRTNRELMREVTLSEAAKSAVAILVASEELSQFGARELNESAYLRCLTAFRNFNTEMKGG